MKPIIVLVIEKPLATSVVLGASRELGLWPDHQLIALELGHPLGRFSYDYGHRHNYNQLPYADEPRWKPREGAVGPRYLMEDQRVAGWHESAEAVLKRADEVVFAADYDVRGAVAFDVLLRETLGDAAGRKAWKGVTLHSHGFYDVMEAMAHQWTSDNEFFQSLIRAGHARRFFDFNFNINARLLFNPLLTKAGAVRPIDLDYGISKYMLQILFHLHDNPGLRESDVLRQMQAWQGSGRYDFDAEMGSPSSQAWIIEHLERLRLVAADARQVHVTPVGEAFLNFLHPDCRDPDLPHRLALWEDTWPDTRPAMVRYLKTFFGKQKRFHG